ncbi:sucrase ferredoxin [Actinokineospora sp.]|uniref:sucrase ferredoxin n=1 Tax=Actinokineospora sp. TaxID=1872133 RepID=UPI003D6A83B1
MATTPPALPDTACSVLSRTLNEPLEGTAATAATWLCLEQPGPWGRDALRESHLDPAVGAELAEQAKGTGVRIVLIRRPGKHPDRHTPRPARVYLAHTAPGRTQLRAGTVVEAKHLLDHDFAAWGAGDLRGFGTPQPGPLLLVCTNGRRDVCCALLGRPIAEDLAVEHGDAVWEATHLGGHRFAPTAVLLPTGYAYGALDSRFGHGLLTGVGVTTERCRGRSTWGAVGQVAELAVRDHLGGCGADDLAVGAPESRAAGDWLVPVTHRDGRVWRVAVSERVDEVVRPASCGATPGPVVTHLAHRIM